MFTLGNKEAIVNDLSHFTTTWTTGTGILNVKGFGDFLKTQGVVASKIQEEFKAESFGKGTVTCPTAAAIGVIGLREPVTFLLRVNTSRYSSEWATDFIKRGRPFVLELSLDSTDTAANVATKLAAAFTEYENKFKTTDNSGGSLPFDWSTATAVITMTLKAGHLSFGGTSTFMRKNDTFGLNVDLGTAVSDFTVDNDPALAANTDIDFTGTGDIEDYLAVGDTITINGISAGIVSITNGAALTGKFQINRALTLGTATDDITYSLEGFEADVDGKYLEENVAMSTQYNDGAYTIAPGERPIIEAPYVTMSWEMLASDGTGQSGTWAPHEGLSTFAPGAATGTRTMKYTMYFNGDVFGTFASPTASSQLEDVKAFLAAVV